MYATAGCIGLREAPVRHRCLTPEDESSGPFLFPFWSSRMRAGRRQCVTLSQRRALLARPRTTAVRSMRAEDAAGGEWRPPSSTSGVGPALGKVRTGQGKGNRVDGERFDYLARRLAAAVSRRAALKVLTAGLGGGFGGMLGMRQARAIACGKGQPDCPGCCQGQTCQAGTSNNQCGFGGQNCANCGNGLCCSQDLRKSKRHQLHGLRYWLHIE